MGECGSRIFNFYFYFKKRGTDTLLSRSSGIPVATALGLQLTYEDCNEHPAANKIHNEID
jgi:hypothetical protein